MPRRAAGRRASRARAPSTSPSLSPLVGSVSRLVDGLASEESLDLRLRAALEILREALGASGCAVHVALDSAPARSYASGALPSGWEAAPSRPDRLLVLPLDHRGRALGRLVVAPPPDDSRGRELTELAGLTARLIVSALLQEWRVGAAGAAVDARSAEVDAQRRFIARVVDSLPVGLYVVDRQYRVRAWNRTRESGLQGVARDAALGRPVFDVLYRRPAEMLRREFDAVFASGDTHQQELETGSGANRRWYRVTKIPMRLDGAEVTHVIAIGEDMTDGRRAQERVAQAEKLAAVGQLAAGVMHEVNNPLAVIGACAESAGVRLARDDVSEELRAALAEYLGIIDHEVQRCKRIVTGLLDFSRPSVARETPFDLRQVVDETLSLLRHHARVKRLRVETRLADEPVTVVGAREQMVQVLIALLLNAADAVEDEGAVRVRVARDPRGNALLEVADDGKGIAPTDRSRLFEPFFTTKPPGRGTGLGLSICYGIVTEHGGRIEVESEPEPDGRGSTFRVVLPARDER